VWCVFVFFLGYGLPFFLDLLVGNTPSLLFANIIFQLNVPPLS